MLNWNRYAKLNVKVLIILIIVTIALGASLFTARQIRRSLISKMALQAGLDAYEKEDWPAVYSHFMDYLSRNPDDVEILKKYAEAALSIRPMRRNTIIRAIAAYRHILRLAPQEDIAYEKLAMLYPATGNYEDLAYIARSRIQKDPNDPKALFWLSEALIELNKTDEARTELTKALDIFKALPEKHPEYIRACILMSQIILEGDSFDEEIKALEKLNAAVEYDPNSIEALAFRAWFYRQTPGIPDMNEPGTPDMSEKERLRRAQKDLDKADIVGTDNPRFRLFLAREWMAHAQWDRAAYELKAAENLPLEIIQDYFLDLNEWTVARFQLAAELAIQRRNIDEGISRADETLKELEDKSYRVGILPFAIRLYINKAERTQDANDCLEEYIKILRTNEGQSGSKQEMAYLRALVANAKNDSYAVIDILQSTVLGGDSSNPDLWGLLAEAFSRTDQPRRAVTALIEYLRLRRNPGMTLLLTQEYIKLQDWNKALETARLAETMDPASIVVQLLRVEASINIVAEQSEINKDRLLALAGELAELRKAHPNRVDIRILQAIIAEYLDRPEEAEEELKLAIEECEETLAAEIQLVRFYSRAKRMTDAISIGQAACEQHSEVAEPWLYLSGLYVANKDSGAARSCLKQAQKEVVGKREKRSISINRALLELTQGNQGDRALGISILSEVAAQDKREIRARTLLLGIPEIQKDQAKAQDLIDELKKAEGETGLMWRLCQAEVWLKSDQWRSKQVEIANYLQYCIDLDPQWSFPPLLLGTMYEQLQDFKHLEDTYRQALVRNPSAIDIADKLVTLLEKQSRFSDAEKVLQQSEMNSRFASARQPILSIRAGEFTRATEELKLRVKADNRDANSRILLARLIYWQTGNVDQALEYLNEAEAIAPGTLVLTAAKVSILKADGQTEYAQRVLNDYVANNDVFEAYMMRGAYFANEGEFERAEQDYIKLTTFAGQGARGYELLSNFYGRNERFDKAVEALEEGLNAYPEDLILKRRLMKTLFLQSPAQDQQRALEILTELEEQLPQDPELMKFQALHILEDSTPQSLKAAR
ncbi:MAG: hypothetical protein RQ760_15140, partial [Sedimentisphaerales bacterium]|nr:hypothetical protein [Sedimentisphaerales bacterium]